MQSPVYVKYGLEPEDELLHLYDPTGDIGYFYWLNKYNTEYDSLIDEIGHLDAELSIIISKDDGNPSLTEDNNLHKAKALYAELEIKIASATRTHEALRKKELVEMFKEGVKR